MYDKDIVSTSQGITDRLLEHRTLSGIIGVGGAALLNILPICRLVSALN